MPWVKVTAESAKWKFNGRQDAGKPRRNFETSVTKYPTEVTPGLRPARERPHGNIQPLNGAQQIVAIDQIGFPTLRAPRGEMRHGPRHRLGRGTSAMRTSDRNAV
jgi:hypothetical protein